MKSKKAKGHSCGGMKATHSKRTSGGRAKKAKGGPRAKSPSTKDYPMGGHRT